MSVMAGVFEQRTRWHKTVIHSDLKAAELEAAKEILAEVFRIGLGEVEVMISSRLQEVQTEDSFQEKEGRWPQEFWVDR